MSFVDPDIVIDSNVVETVSKELQDLDDGEFLHFAYKGDGLSSSEETYKFQMLQLLLNDEYLEGKTLKALGSKNQITFNVRLTSKGYELLDNK